MKIIIKTELTVRIINERGLSIKRMRGIDNECQFFIIKEKKNNDVELFRFIYNDIKSISIKNKDAGNILICKEGEFNNLLEEIKLDTIGI